MSEIYYDDDGNPQIYEEVTSFSYYSKNEKRVYCIYCKYYKVLTGIEVCVHPKHVTEHNAQSCKRTQYYSIFLFNDNFDCNLFKEV